MSRENVEAVRRWIAAYNERDLAGMIAFSAPDIQFRSIFAGLESGGVFRGYPGLAEYFKALADAYDRFLVLPNDFVDAGAAVIVEADADWIGRESGAAARTPVFPVCWLRAGKLFRIETVSDRATAFEVVGMAEERPPPDGI